MRSKNRNTPLRVIFLSSHPIQYYAPLYRYMDQKGGVDLIAVYCSDHGVEDYMDEGFGVKVKWDVPLLEGYQHVFLKNYAFSPSVFNMWGLVNWGVIPFLFRSSKSVLIVHGWGYFTNLLAIVFGKLSGHIVCIRGDNPRHHELARSKVGIWMRRVKYEWFIFRFIDYFLYVGKESKDFYRFFNVPERKLLFTPHAVDNEGFSKSYRQLLPKKEELKQALGLPKDRLVILYSGKYIAEKSPMDLLRAYAMGSAKEKASLVFMGDGNIREEMENFVKENNLTNVYLTGFINQSRVPEYYTVADVFVMCSQSETWGLSVNEAMNFELPLILSEETSCSHDLLANGENGYVFKSGDVTTLAALLDKLTDLPSSKRVEMGKASRDRVRSYSYGHITENLNQLKPKILP